VIAAKLTGGMMMHASRLIALCAVAATGLAPAAAVMAGNAASAATVAATASHARPGAVPGGTRLWVRR
jgi:hypothetical protein